MLNEEKIKLMTELAVFEKNEGRKVFPVNRYFKSDYVGGHLLRSFFGYTFCYILLMAMWVMYKVDLLLNYMNLDDILRVAKRWGLVYIAGLVVYLIISRWVWAARYDYASRMQIVYMAKLKRLNKRYENQGRIRDMAKEDRRYDKSAGT